MFADRTTTGIAAWQRPCLIAGLVGGLVCVAGALVQPGAFWPGYLVAYIFWLGIALGSLGIALLHRLTGGRWGWSLSRSLVSASGTLLLMAILFVPLAAGAATLYPFGGGESHGQLNARQEWYFALPFFFGRAAGYFGFWIFATIGITRVTRRDSQTGVIGRGARISAISLLLFFLLATFAVFDWMMSLEPGWYSTIYGAMHVVGFAVSAFAFGIIARHLGSGSLASGGEPDGRTQDLGSMLLAFNLIWVYFAFSQWLIVWSGDLPFETAWYRQRSAGGWGIVAPLLIFLHFVVPFALLLSRDVKSNTRRLAGVAGLLLVGRLVDLTWSIVPACDEGGLMTGVYGLAALIGVGGLWLFVFGRRWKQLPMLAESSVVEAVHAKTTHSAEAAT